eukprot:471567-Prorocentrum_minimum.AAC.2
MCRQDVVIRARYGRDEFGDLVASLLPLLKDNNFKVRCASIFIGCRQRSSLVVEDASRLRNVHLPGCAARRIDGSPAARGILQAAYKCDTESPGEMPGFYAVAALFTR